jgi:hypothetical protein
MSTQPPTRHAWVVLRSIYEHPIPTGNDRCVCLSEAFPLMIAATPELAIEALQRCKTVETSDERTADCAVSMLQSTSDGVDILLIPKNGDVKHEVRLRVKRVELLGAIGQEAGG